MKKVLNIIASIIIFYGMISCSSCDGSKSADEQRDTTKSDSVLGAEKEVPMKKVDINGTVYNVADIDDSCHIYKDVVKKKDCMIVISKREFRLYVYECGVDTVLAASFPVCYAKNAEAKTRSGDMCTPECDLENPFSIKEIQNADSWVHDFGDGRGEIKSYGKWFIRLETGFNGIGIHGSTNNEGSVPGRDSEGCIRLRDADIIKFHDLYAEVGQKVIIKSVNKQKFDFEIKAEQELGDRYVNIKEGYKMP